MTENSQADFSVENADLVGDGSKTQEQLMSEIAALRQQVFALQAEVSTLRQTDDEQRILQRERFIARMAQTIRQSLNLHQVLDTTVEEVRRFLRVDRVVVYRFQPDWSGRIAAESVSESSLSVINQEIYDPCFVESMLYPYRQGRIHRINDVLTAEIEPCYAELLKTLHVRAVLVIPILVKNELWGLLGAHQCTSSRHWEELNWLMLQQLSNHLAIGIHQAELYQQIQQQAHREQALNQVIQDIRNSLDLNTVFATATSEIGRFLQVDRAEIVQYLPDDRCWLNVSSYRRHFEMPNALGIRIPDESNALADRLKRREVVYVGDYRREADATNQSFAEAYPGTWLLVPLEVGDEVWGSLSLNHQSRWHWEEWEVNLAKAIANQLGIAIQQSQLYIEIQDLNNDLEDLVRFRTAQLHQALGFEALLKRITDKVRDSLDESQILQTAVEELSDGLELLGCDTALYDCEQQIATICFEYIRSELPHAEGTRIQMAGIPDLYQQLLHGQTAQFCHACQLSDLTPVPRQGFAILACPMIDEGQVVGDMWLFKPCHSGFDGLEIRLAQQVANQCAIALRQSRLYQAAQAQVQELERLNRLKDDFLSTVSHELRTPMSSIKMAVQMLELTLFGRNDPSRIHRPEPGSTPASGKPFPTLPSELAQPIEIDRLHRYFQILEDECDREIRLINDLLDLSRIDAETDPLLLTPLDLSIWIPHVAESFVELAHSQQQQFEFSFAADLPLIMTDMANLERIITELLNNACKYSPPNEVITVSVQMTDPENNSHLAQFLIQISNTGVEISEQEYDRIFQTFYRIPNNDPWKYGGTGLGLALIKKLVQRLQGSIQVNSGDRCTTFTLVLPDLG
ncbi:sensor histidine kinase [Egbenema bharatensis]|uniref:sensor histidine kinase n=1 Tax=Egbenema bharatensis TaxID=3463334 RepID=UPI003A88C7F3